METLVKWSVHVAAAGGDRSAGLGWYQWQREAHAMLGDYLSSPPSLDDRFLSASSGTAAMFKPVRE